LVDDQFVQLFVDGRQLVDGLGEVCDLFVALYVLGELCLPYLHFVELVLHLLAVLFSQLDGGVESA
jgi:hypothetical protein